MRRLTIFLVTIISLTIFNSCDGNFSIFKEGDEYTIVYGYLDVDADTNYIKITKSFTGNALEMAPDYSASNYDYKLDAKLIGKFASAPSRVSEVSLDTVSVFKPYDPDGLFYSGRNQLLYYTTEKLLANEYYQLKIIRKDSVEITSKVKTISSSSIRQPVYNISFESGYTNKIEYFIDSVKTLEEYKRLKPDLLLLDLDMPKLNGLEIINSLSKDTTEKKKCNIIVISGNAPMRYDLLNTAKIYKIIPKPIDLPKILEDINQFAEEFSANEGISQKNIRDILFELKIHPSSKSGKYVLEAIELLLKDPSLLENIKDIYHLISKKHKPQFDLICEKLEDLGYNNYWKVLNGKDFGVPQNRERVMMVSIRKDVDNGEFEMPSGYPLTVRLRDILQSEVDESYYKHKEYKLVNRGKVVAEFIKGNFDQGKRIYGIDSYFQTLSARERGCNNILLDDGRVRKLTPIECWRLMGHSDEDFYKAKEVGLPQSKLYERAGRGIVVPMLEEIFRNLLLK